MAKKDKISGKTVEVQASEVIQKAKGTFGVKGLKGTAADAKITVLVASNPKRVGSAAHSKFALYRDGLTQAEFLAAGGTTPDLAYDTSHGFIIVEGYAPPKMFEATVRAPKAEKTTPAKGKRTKAPKSEDVVQAEAELAASVNEEIID